MKVLSLNLLIAVIWLLFSQTPSTAVFAQGFVIGFILLAAFRKVIGADEYIRRWFALLRFVLMFAREFIVANLKVAWVVIFRSPGALRPGFVTCNISDLSPMEILILSYCITLTPGTTTVDIASDFKTLTFHTLGTDNTQDLLAHIDHKLKPALLGFTR